MAICKLLLEYLTYDLDKWLLGKDKSVYYVVVFNVLLICLTPF